MLFSRSISLTNLIQLCRVLRHSMEAGLVPTQILRQQAERGSLAFRPIALRMSEELQQGSSLHDAMKKQACFPPLLLTLVSLGEKTGYLPEIMGSLEKYYQTQQNLSRQFRSQILLPAIQFFLGVGIIAFVIWIFGVIDPSPSGLKLLGLRGTSGALIFLGIVFGVLIGVFVGYRQLSGYLRGKAAVDRFLLGLPGIGPCVRALAMSRFTLAMQLTLDTGMPVQKAVAASLQATGNAAFEAQVKRVKSSVREGDDLTTALSQTGLFTDEFRSLFAVAEESGRVPEVMRSQCKYFVEEAERRLKGLAQMSAWLVWLIYAIFIITMIFQLAGIYFQSPALLMG